VVQADARLEGITADQQALVCRLRIAKAIHAYREDREPKVLLARTAYSAAALLGLGLTMFGLMRLSRRVEATLDRRYKDRIRSLEIHSFQIVQAQQLWAAILGLERAVRALVLLVLGLVGLYFVLGRYPWTRFLAQGLLDLIAQPLATLGLGVVESVPSLVFLAILFILARWLLNIMRLFFGAVAQGTVQFAGFEADWAWPTYRLLRILVVAFAVIVAYPYIPGSQSEAFKGVSLFLGIVFSLGSSSAIANVIAGYTMTYRRAFRIGDRIKVDDVLGDVVETRLMVTHLRSLKNEELVIPNTLILNSSVTNYSSISRQRGLILHTTVSIGYEVPWRQVEAMLLLAAERTAGLLRQPPPFILLKSLGDFAVSYELNAYCSDPTAMFPLYTALHRHILDVFNEYGVQIMTPAYEGDPEQPKVVPKEAWFSAPARLPDR
jgi:small-conductance mechanosensitive channel